MTTHGRSTYSIRRDRVFCSHTRKSNLLWHQTYSTSWHLITKERYYPAPRNCCLLNNRDILTATISFFSVFIGTVHGIYASFVTRWFDTLSLLLLDTDDEEAGLFLALFSEKWLRVFRLCPYESLYTFKRQTFAHVVYCWELYLQHCTLQ